MPYDSSASDGTVSGAAKRRRTRKTSVAKPRKSIRLW